MKCRLRRGGRLAWRHVARTVDSVTPTSAAISRADMPVGSRSRICCFFAALIGRQAVLRVLPAVVVSLASVVDAKLSVLDSGATSPAMRHLRKASRGSQLFELMLPRCTTASLYKPSPLARKRVTEFLSHRFRLWTGCGPGAQSEPGEATELNGTLTLLISGRQR